MTNFDINRVNLENVNMDDIFTRAAVAQVLKDRLDVPVSAIASLMGVSSRTVYYYISDYLITDMRLNEIEELIVDTKQKSEEPKYKYFTILTDSAVSISRVCLVTGDISSVNATASDDDFYDVSRVLISGTNTQESQAQAFEMLDPTAMIENFKTEESVSHDFGNGLKVENDTVVYTDKDGDAYSFTGVLVNRLVEGMKKGDETIVKSLRNFLRRLTLNPHEHVVKELYDFLEASDITIDEDGYVRCWKKITQDWKDVYTKTIDNSVGTVVRMKRNKVNPNSRELCSYGLHVASWSYLRHYSGDRIVEVSVDPRDFVSIPEDYYSVDSVDGNVEVKAKARVCKYKVLREVKL